MNRKAGSIQISSNLPTGDDGLVSVLGLFSAASVAKGSDQGKKDRAGLRGISDFDGGAVCQIFIQVADCRFFGEFPAVRKLSVVTAIYFICEDVLDPHLRQPPEFKGDHFGQKKRLRRERSLLNFCGRCWFRTSDPCRVKAVLYR